MNDEQNKAYEWAKNQNYQSVAAQYAKILAGVIDEMHKAKTCICETVDEKVPYEYYPNKDVIRYLLEEHLGKYAIIKTKYILEK